MKIMKFIFKVDGSIPASFLANTRAAAVACLRRTMGKDSKIEYVREEFSHNVGDFEDTVVPKKPAAAETEGFDSVVEAYGRHSKVRL